MDGRDGGPPLDPVTGERRRPSRADSLRLTRMPQIPRATPPPGQGGGPAGPPAPARPVSQPEAVRPRRSTPRRRVWIVVAGAVLLLAVPIALAAVHRTRERPPAAAAVPAPVESTAEPETAAPSSSPSPPAIPPLTGVASSAPVAPSASVPASGVPTAKPGVTGRANPSGANLALQGTASASGSEGDPWKPVNAIDGDPSSRWSSGFSDTQWFRVDLGRNWQISEIVLVWEHAYATAYRVETSRDGRTWERVYSTTTGTGGTVKINETGVARHVRMYGVKRVSTYGYSLLELEVR